MSIKQYGKNDEIVLFGTAKVDKLSKKKVSGIVVGAAILGGFTANTVSQFNAGIQQIQAKADTTIYGHGTDVASYQGNNVQTSGNSFTFVKLTEGLSYVNPYAAAQISASRKAGLNTWAYHYAHFNGSTTEAANEADYFIKNAKANGYKEGDILALDLESDFASKQANTDSALVFMDKVYKAGFRPVIYSSSSMLATYFNIDQINAKYKNAIWVAAYPLGNKPASGDPDFNYFPSMSNVAFWQYTSNKDGTNTDASVQILPLDQISSYIAASSASSAASSAASQASSASSAASSASSAASSAASNKDSSAASSASSAASSAASEASSASSTASSASIAASSIASDITSATSSASSDISSKVADDTNYTSDVVDSATTDSDSNDKTSPAKEQAASSGASSSSDSTSSSSSSQTSSASSTPTSLNSTSSSASSSSEGNLANTSSDEQGEKRKPTLFISESMGMLVLAGIVATMKNKSANKKE